MPEETLTTEALVRQSLALIEMGVYTPLATWKNVEKERYYKVFIGRDLLGDLILEREWGSLVTARHNSKKEFCDSRTNDEIEKAIRKLHSQRKYKGYVLTSITGLKSQQEHYKASETPSMTTRKERGNLIPINIPDFYPPIFFGESVPRIINA